MCVVCREENLHPELIKRTLESSVPLGESHYRNILAVV